ncbi:23S rRNA (adenine(1618)-N(6))-methyltransferase RlmF [Undibacterium jejuense]|uniref:Ribosomal RNA large subunit methyltransferase F n=1 Tax=Undibacterium jejuense TaxID=1344949 RepID=A0A923KLY0_9BURK|nr:23S rRNA (adenine(1618)-N(6))-methyltransferase RlmF [Undibacterium jejuense]MBC3863535.1 23S rRNA (adenine(1618)-N(6))-methyltransferase RlmF [Undibacterium jejuense]
MPTTVQPFHAKNRHQGQYDFARLTQASPALQGFITSNQHGGTSIDFSDPLAVKTLNAAILKSDYSIIGWDIPEGQLCPPIPGRADYIHYLADLLSHSNNGKYPKKKRLDVLDVGTGASGIYPLLGVAEYAWHFVAADINQDSLNNVRQILSTNQALSERITLRLQSDPNAIFKHIVSKDDWFDLTMCNPPFHISLAEAQAGTQRKWRNLGKVSTSDEAAPLLNFGGQGAELWCPGGELAFIERMIKESADIQGQCFWFTCLVSKSANLAPLKTALKRAQVYELREVNMAQGNKQSRFLAWTFLNPVQQAGWKKMRW